jgi:hypothetical protein
MTEVPGGKKMTFSIYAIEGRGLPDHYVEADLFSKKVRAVLSALKKADRIANGRGRLPHVYYVTELKTGSAEVSVAELRSPFSAGNDGHVVSSMDTFLSCARYLQAGDFDRAARFDGLPGVIESISKGASETFSHITFVPEAEADAPLRVDEFFERQVQRFMERVEAVDNVVAVAPPTYFRGTTFDAFDGELKAVDMRGAVWAGTLVLTGTKVEIDCSISGPTLKEVQENLNMRVWAEGRAIYSETSGLPERFEVSRMRPITIGGDLRRWRGQLSADDGGRDEIDWYDQ